jgi:hypothetical protein
MLREPLSLRFVIALLLPAQEGSGSIPGTVTGATGAALLRAGQWSTVMSHTLLQFGLQLVHLPILRGGRRREACLISHDELKETAA